MKEKLFSNPRRKEYENLKNDFLLENIERLVNINNMFIKSKFNSSKCVNQYQFEGDSVLLNQANLEKVIALGLELYTEKTGKKLKGFKAVFED